MSAQPWAEAHRREAIARLCQMSATHALAGGRVAIGPCSSEALFVAALAPFFGLGSARIGREVRRVRALAEGRLVRETVTLYVVPQSDHDVVSVERAAVEARAEQANTPVRTIRVTRIRKATP